MDIAVHENKFQEFAQGKINEAKGDKSPLELKLLHTFKVLDNAKNIAAQEGFDVQLTHICALASLYHDIARFDQYLQFGTFKDSQSRNHGLWAVTIIRQLGLLQDEPPQIRQMVLTAISVHNRLEVPTIIIGKALLASNTLRDADKLDIVRVMDEHLSGPGPYNPTVVLGLPDDLHLHSKKTIACALNHEPGTYADLCSVNDFRLLLGTWLFAMNFDSSREMLKHGCHARNVVRALPDNHVYGAARQELLTRLETQ